MSERSLLEDENTRDEVREMATDEMATHEMATSSTKLTHPIRFLARFARPSLKKCASLLSAAVCETGTEQSIWNTIFQYMVSLNQQIVVRDTGTAVLGGEVGESVGAVDVAKSKTSSDSESDSDIEEVTVGKESEKSIATVPPPPPAGTNSFYEEEKGGGGEMTLLRETMS